MKLTKKRGFAKKYTQKRKHSFQKLSRHFENEITKVFLEMIIMIKLWHWKTFSYSTHKATDELYSRLNEHMDRFIEVLLGKTEVRIDLTKEKSLPLLDYTDVNAFKNKILWFKGYLVSLDNQPFMKQMSNTDLLNIRDEILGDLNQFLYLLTFK